MNIKTVVKFKFRGSRDYIHSSDMYAAFVEATPATIKENAGSLQMRCNHMIGKNALITSDREHSHKPDSFLTVKSKLPGQPPFSLYLFAIDETPGERIPYDENQMVDGWLFGENDCSAEIIRSNPDYTVFQTIVALNKIFLSKLNSNPSGKWRFAGFQSGRFIPDQCNSIRLVSKPTRLLRLVRSKIEIDGEPFGEIYFSLN